MIILTTFYGSAAKCILELLIADLQSQKTRQKYVRNITAFWNFRPANDGLMSVAFSKESPTWARQFKGPTLYVGHNRMRLFFHSD